MAAKRSYLPINTILPLLPYGGWQNSDGMARLHALIRERFPKGIQITVEQIIAHENYACVNIRNYAERVDGRIYDNQIVFLLTIENGLIVEQKEFLDTIMVNALFCGELYDEDDRR